MGTETVCRPWEEGFFINKGLGVSLGLAATRRDHPSAVTSSPAVLEKGRAGQQDGDPPLGCSGLSREEHGGKPYRLHWEHWKHALIQSMLFVNTSDTLTGSQAAPRGPGGTHETDYLCAALPPLLLPSSAAGLPASHRLICRHMSAGCLRAALAFPNEATRAACVCHGRGIPLQGKHGAGAGAGNRALQDEQPQRT